MPSRCSPPDGTNDPLCAVQADPLLYISAWSDALPLHFLSRNAGFSHDCFLSSSTAYTYMLTLSNANETARCEATGTYLIHVPDVENLVCIQFANLLPDWATICGKPPARMDRMKKKEGMMIGLNQHQHYSFCARVE